MSAGYIMCDHIMMCMYQWICLVYYTAPIAQSPSAAYNLSLQSSEKPVPSVHLSEIPDDITLGKCI